MFENFNKNKNIFSFFSVFFAVCFCFFSFASAVEGANLISNSSLEDYSGNVPIGWQAGNWGNNISSFVYPVTGHQGGRAAQINMSFFADGDAKWFFNDVAVVAGGKYIFSDYYKSSMAGEITARFALENGDFSYVWLGSYPVSADWSFIEKEMIVPNDAISVTIFHLLSGVGSLTVDNFSLQVLNNQTGNGQPSPQAQTVGMVSINFDDGWRSAYERAMPILDEAGFKTTQYIITSASGWDGYINKQEIQSLYERGHEIGSHSVTHPYLNKLSLKRIIAEVWNSLSWLKNIGIAKVSTFSYPYGEYNARSRSEVAKAYLAARGVEEGVNDKNTDRFLLKSHSLENTTSFEEVKANIDRAVAENGWYIIVLHKIDESEDQYSVSSEMIRKIVAYLKEKNIKVVTNEQGANTLFGN